MNIRDRVEKLRQLMKENQMDAYIIPSFDAHQSEYVAEHWKCRQWISGFTGSAGTAVITLEDAGLWTDGRYYIQAEKQLEGSGIRLFRMVDPGVPFYSEWLADVLNEGSIVGFDGNVFSINMVKKMEKDLKAKRIVLKMNQDLIGDLWEDRPEIPKGPIFTHDVKYAGKSRLEKLNEVRKEMKNIGANYYILTSLDDIAWLLNIRGADVPNNPVVIANVIVAEHKCYLFIDSCKVSPLVKLELEAEGIELKANHEIQTFLGNLTSGDTIILDANKTNSRLYNAINSNTKKIEIPDITTHLKAIKNEVEIKNVKWCEIKDGIAMVKFIKWLKTVVDKEEITEIAAEERLEDFRRAQEGYVGTSFDTIAGYKEHAAMMHYKANKETQYTLKNEGLFLIDSGGQYYDGTTDITRTIVLGKLTDEQKRDYTLVLKGFIALSSVKYLHGATGSHLDVLARQPIWQYGLDYKCGTGHGVGFFLNVHEGPQSIRNNNHVTLEKGMIITNEPGIYLEGKYGIRIENMLIVDEDEKTEFGQFMNFETITYCPIDLAGINKDMLTESEKQWLNNYHQEVYTKLAPYLNEEESGWLREETREI
ncbi:aminopeptidase P family protein [Paenibacillus macquariensis]|uniref:Xaa-Pro aminopeptidase n=1 Tax=Paenibacillus macquariensis TaxID=948756 RepID=A0ABY1JZ36_9BACL|nr:aminopeptidase P family protein [Paenibacillus macquariensis]MEC0091224.1 aminopeptidase P family protein [Paenibacillus macquariensis]OAB37923.1 peptidase M24 [Paenibacillus macquariensis subsp. macquariensis]SIR02147.1 Xaa-Pro aminopeptidase [Paenibacillus macquariensis]